jgi:hypothetical protein
MWSSVEERSVARTGPKTWHETKWLTDFDHWTAAFAAFVQNKGKVEPGRYRAFGYKAPGHLWEGFPLLRNDGIPAWFALKYAAVTTNGSTQGLSKIKLAVLYLMVTEC